MTIEKFVENIHKGSVEKDLAFIEKDKMYFSYRILQKEDGEIECNICRLQDDGMNKVYGKDIIEAAVKAVEEAPPASSKLVQLAMFQPGIETMYKAYEKTMYKIAYRFARLNKKMSVDELMHEIRIAMFLMKKNGWYIHKRAIEVYLRNVVLENNRKEMIREKYEAFSLDTVNSDEPDGEPLYASFADERDEDEKNEKEIKESREEAFSDLRDYIVRKYGQRQYEQLLFEYGWQCTGKWARTLVYRIKKGWLKKVSL